MLLVYNMKNKFDMDSIVSKISTNPNWLGFSIFFTALALFIDWMVASKSWVNEIDRFKTDLDELGFGNGAFR